MKFQMANWTVKSWTTPLYTIPFNNFVVWRGLHTGDQFFVEMYASKYIYGGIVGFQDFSVASVNSNSLSVLGSYDQVYVSGRPQDVWLSKVARRRKDSSDKTVYKYLIRCEGKELEQRGAKVIANFTGRLVWDNMPPLTDVMAMAETEAGLTLLLEGEKLVFFGRETIGVISD
jgi:hypothetical protein